jgi:hypothetical protein
MFCTGVVTLPLNPQVINSPDDSKVSFLINIYPPPNFPFIPSPPPLNNYQTISPTISQIVSISNMALQNNKVDYDRGFAAGITAGLNQNSNFLQHIRRTKRSRSDNCKCMRVVRSIRDENPEARRWSSPSSWNYDDFERGSG